jgi:hypothetical protein
VKSRVASASSRNLPEVKELELYLDAHEPPSVSHRVKSGFGCGKRPAGQEYMSPTLRAERFVEAAHRSDTLLSECLTRHAESIKGLGRWVRRR